MYGILLSCLRYLNLMDRLQSYVCNVVCPEVSAPLQSFAHCQDVASLNLFNRYYFGICSSGICELVGLLHACGLIVILDM